MTHGIFGWDLPPGAAGDPNAPWNQDGSVEVTLNVSRPIPEDVAIFWLEDGTLVVRRYNGNDLDGWVDQSVGTLEWNDDMSETDNNRAAADQAWEQFTGEVWS